MGGNCFKASTSDGFSLLRDSEDSSSNHSSTNAIHARGTAPPPYQCPMPMLNVSSPSRETFGQMSAIGVQLKLNEEHQQHVDNSPILNSNHNQPVATQLTEEEQIRKAKRMGLISHLPSGTYDGSKKTRECAICMGEFIVGDCIRYLPCLHTYHRECIDDWMMRSFTCPSCMEPVDAALLMMYETN